MSKETITASLIATNGEVTTFEIDYPIEYDPDFKTLRDMISESDGITCDILEFVAVNDEVCLAVDENGIAMQRELNIPATSFYSPGIYGPAIFFPVSKRELMD